MPKLTEIILKGNVLLGKQSFGPLPNLRKLIISQNRIPSRGWGDPQFLGLSDTVSTSIDGQDRDLTEEEINKYFKDSKKLNLSLNNYR